MPDTTPLSPLLPPAMPASLDLFCKVVDNYGDIGICWRLARQFSREHGIAVRLWVDDLKSFQRLCPAVDIGALAQQVEGVAVRHWRAQEQEADYTAADIPDLVLEFFGCELPPCYVEAMAQCAVKPVWLNLEGLSAEEWVEGCHTLPSPHPRLPLTKHFFFPGFNARTGGLIGEADLQARRQTFIAQGQAPAFLATLGVLPDECRGLTVSLFCYDYAPVAELFDAWRQSPVPVTCLMPDGTARAAVEAFLGAAMRPGAVRTRQALTVRVIHFVPQPDFDKLLWSCDFNHVRGEDSVVRAQWSGKPFIWNIYHQDKNLHHKKLNAFLGIFTPKTASLVAMSHAWNGANRAPVDWPAAWAALAADLPAITGAQQAWIDRMLANGDFVTRLLGFAAGLRLEAAGK